MPPKKKKKKTRKAGFIFTKSEIKFLKNKELSKSHRKKLKSTIFKKLKDNKLMEYKKGLEANLTEIFLLYILLNEPHHWKSDELAPYLDDLEWFFQTFKEFFKALANEDLYATSILKEMLTDIIKQKKNNIQRELGKIKQKINHPSINKQSFEDYRGLLDYHKDTPGTTYRNQDTWFLGLWNYSYIEELKRIDEKIKKETNRLKRGIKKIERMNKTYKQRKGKTAFPLPLVVLRIIQSKRETGLTKEELFEKLGIWSKKVKKKDQPKSRIKRKYYGTSISKSVQRVLTTYEKMRIVNKIIQKEKIVYRLTHYGLKIYPKVLSKYFISARH